MIYKKAREGEWQIKKDYSKKIILSLTDFKQKGHLFQMVNIPPIQNKEIIIISNKQKFGIY